jgi:two-component system sensor histidine kinase CpxA
LIHEGKCNYNGSGDVKSYLMGIAKNVHRQSIKSNLRSPVTVGPDAVPELAADDRPADPLVTAESFELLREKIEQGNFKEYLRYLDDIREDISELDSLIGRILELSKLDIHESPLKFETLNPLDLINDLLERLKPVIERKDLHLKTDLSFHFPFKGDKEALRTAFLNILDNAAKFTPEKGDVVVKMHCEQDFLKIRVTNSFKELPEEDLSRIFDPFHRAERSNAAGSGLGLAITKKIIERHGGNIKAVNSPDGLEIRMRLPAEPPEG